MASRYNPRHPSMASGNNPFEIGITVISAKDLKNVNRRHGDLKPYAVVWVDRNAKCSTRIAEEGHTDPVWNHKLQVPLKDHPNETTLYIDIVHASCEGDTKPLIGSARVPLSEIIDEAGGLGETCFRKLELKRPSGRLHGILEVKIAVHQNRYQPPQPYAPSYGQQSLDVSGYGYGYGGYGKVGGYGGYVEEVPPPYAAPPPLPPPSCYPYRVPPPPPSCYPYRVPPPPPPARYPYRVPPPPPPARYPYRAPAAYGAPPVGYGTPPVRYGAPAAAYGSAPYDVDPYSSGSDVESEKGSSKYGGYGEEVPPPYAAQPPPSSHPYGAPPVGYGTQPVWYGAPAAAYEPAPYGADPYSSGSDAETEMGSSKYGGYGEEVPPPPPSSYPYGAPAAYGAPPVGYGAPAYGSAPYDAYPYYSGSDVETEGSSRYGMGTGLAVGGLAGGLGGLALGEGGEYVEDRFADDAAYPYYSGSEWVEDDLGYDGDDYYF